MDEEVEKFSLLDLAGMFENSENDIILVAGEIEKWKQGSTERRILEMLEKDINQVMSTIKSLEVLNG